MDGIIVGVHQCRSTLNFPIVAWIIMFFQGMRPWDKKAWNHLSCSYIDEAGRLKFFDATGKEGFEEMSDHTFSMKNKILRSTYIEIPATRADLIEWIGDNEPLEYDKSDILGDALTLLGFISNNHLGKDYKKLTCNKVPLKLLRDFRGIHHGDPDKEDLHSTWQIIKKYEINGR